MFPSIPMPFILLALAFLVGFAFNLYRLGVMGIGDLSPISIKLGSHVFHIGVATVMSVGLACVTSFVAFSAGASLRAFLLALAFAGLMYLASQLHLTKLKRMNQVDWKPGTQGIGGGSSDFSSALA